MIGYDESELMDGDTSVLPMSGLPLGGIRVLDLSGPLGSYCARLLADAGADTVVCSITPFGLTGPYRTWRATHLVSHAMSGLMYTQGPLEGPPVVVPGQQLYDQIGTHAAIAVLTALRARPRAGGQLIDMSAHEVLTQSCFAIYDYTNAARIGRRRPQPIQYSGGGTWECRDGVIEFTASTDKHWFALMELL